MNRGRNKCFLDDISEKSILFADKCTHRNIHENAKTLAGDVFDIQTDIQCQGRRDRAGQKQRSRVIPLPYYGPTDGQSPL